MRRILILCLVLFSVSAQAATVTITTTATQDKGVVFMTNEYNRDKGTSLTPVQYATQQINAMLDTWVLNETSSNSAGIRSLFENATEAQKCAALIALGQSSSQASAWLGITCP